MKSPSLVPTNIWANGYFRFVGNTCTGTPERCGEIVSKLLLELKGMDGLFSKWHLSGNSKGAESGKRVSMNKVRLGELFAANGMRDDFFNPRPEWGYSLCLYNAEPVGNSAYMEFEMGGELRINRFNLFNDLVRLCLPLVGQSEKRVYERSTLANVARCFVRHIRPEFGVFTFDDCSTLIPSEYRGENIGWLTFLSKNYDVTAVSRKFEIEPVEEQGYFLWTTPTRISVKNAAHRKRFQELHELLAPQLEIKLEDTKKRVRTKKHVS